MSLIQFIPYAKRTQQSHLIKQIGEVVFGTSESAMFAEEFVPKNGQVPHPKVQNFSAYLTMGPKCLWAVYSGETRKDVAGFILIADMPHQNAIGFGLSPLYARQGLMSRAFQEILVSPECIQFPLNAYTSENNHAAIQFFDKQGFQFIENVIYDTEPSVHYIFNLIQKG